MLAATGFPPEFHAPPPSPEAVERSEGAGEGDKLQGLLHRGNAVPKLVLPDPIFPRQINSVDPPEFDFRSLGAPPSLEDLRSAARRIGCFQLVNHGIPREVISAAEDAAAGLFRLAPETKAGLVTERRGFEGEVESREGGGDEEELFWWRHGVTEGGSEAAKTEMAGIWPEGYHDFSCKMGRLRREIGKVASKLGPILFSKSMFETPQNTKFVTRTGEEAIESTLHINRYKQGQGSSAIEDGLPNVLQHDAVRLLIRGCEHPHALCIHVTSSSGFQVFSKRGWNSFHPNNEALVVTIGNQMPGWTGSLYRHVMGKPVFAAKDKDSISIAALYSCPTMEEVCRTIGGDKKVIPLVQQAMFAVFLTLLCHIIAYLCHNM